MNGEQAYQAGIDRPVAPRRLGLVRRPPPAPGSATTAAACSHCHLPIGRLGQQRAVNGEVLQFCCYGCCIAYQVRHGVREEHEAAWLLIRLGVGAFLAMNIMLFSLLLYSGSFGPSEGALVRAIHVLLWILATPVLLILGEPFLRGAWRAAREGQASADTLVSLGAMAAYGYSAFAVVTAADSVYFDTVTMVLVLFSLGRYLEALGRARAMRSLAPMLAAERSSATVVEDGRDRVTPVQAIERGTVVRVRPGECVPVDGIVIEGRSHCDETVLSGQPDPRPKGPGANVYAGSVNGTGQLLIRTTAAGAATRWGQNARYVREALSRKSLVGELVDRAAALFVPGVVLLAGATVLYWSGHVPFDRALMTGLAVLVVACPCALGLAAPIATALGLGRAAQRGMLLRSGSVLERLARIRGVAFDKTGTLTKGQMRLAECLPLSASEAELLRRAAGLARGSEHPVAGAISEAALTRNVRPLEPRALQAHPGEGVIGDLGGARTAMGSAAFMQRLGWPLPPNPVNQASGGGRCRSTVFVGWDGAVRGLLLLEDPPMAEARSVVSTLARLGISSFLLSGDTPAAVARAAGAAGIENWHGGLSPMAKVDILRAWAGGLGPVAMVGDGLNDGPVLAEAAVGIAVGGATDLARETADVRLPKDGLDSLPWLFEHARRVRRTIITNIVWAFGYNATALSLAAAGLLQPIVAAALMAGSSLVVVVNSLLVGREPSGYARAPAERTARGGRRMTRSTRFRERATPPWPAVPPSGSNKPNANGRSKSMPCRRWLIVSVILFGAGAFYAASGSNRTQAQDGAVPVEQLIETVSEAADPQVRARAAQDLGSLGVAPARVAPVLVQVLRWDGDPAVRGRAAEALGRIGPAEEQVVPALIEALEWDHQLPVRWRAAEALKRIGAQTEEVVPALIKALQEDKYPGVRAGVAQALGEIGPKTDEIFPALISALEQDEHPGVRWQAATALERAAVRLRDASATGSIASLKQALAALSVHDHPEIQRSAHAVREAILQLEAHQSPQVAK